MVGVVVITGTGAAGFGLAFCLEIEKAVSLGGGGGGSWTAGLLGGVPGACGGGGDAGLVALASVSEFVGNEMFCGMAGGAAVIPACASNRLANTD